MKKIGLGIVTMVAMLAFSQVVSASASTYTWNGTAADGDWDNSANWDGNGVPVDEELTLAGLNGDMLIIFDGAIAPSSTPLFRGYNAANTPSKLPPYIQVNQGAVTVSIYRDGWWLKTAAVEGVHEIINVAPGATLTLDSDTTSFQTQRGGIATKTALITIQSGGVLAVDAYHKLSGAEAAIVHVTIESGGSLETQGLNVAGFYSNTISLESTASVTFLSGTGLSTLAEVESYFGSTFLGAGVTLTATDNGDGTFTVSGNAGVLPSKATDPSPVNNATAVDVDMDLAWTVGAGSLSNVVYFGEAGSMTLQTNTSATSFDPGTLAYGGTNYEWRIDSANALGTTTGDVWSFATEPVPPAPGQVSNPDPADASSNILVSTNLSWTAASDAKTYDVYFGLASTNMTLVSAAQTATDYTPALGYETNYQWRVDAVNFSGTNTGPVWTFSTEVAPPMPGQASNPVPVDDAVEQLETVDLAWDAASDAASYKIYYGPAGNVTANNLSSTVSSRELPTLAFETEYDWRIDSVNGSGTTTGLVWSFTTRAKPVFNYAWSGAVDGNWSNAANWDAEGVPVDQDAGQAGLTGNMTIIIDGATVPANAPLLGGHVLETRNTPKVRLRQGTMDWIINKAGWWIIGGTNHILTVGNGSDAATLNLISTDTGLVMARETGIGQLFTATVNSNATLACPDTIKFNMINKPTSDFQLTLKAGATLTTGELRDDNWGPETYIGFEDGSSYTFKASGALNTAEKIDALFGTWLRPVNGATLQPTILTNGFLVVTATGGTPATPFSDWADSWGLSGPDADQTANPDGDSLNNLYEYGLGGNPTKDVDSAKLPVYTLLDDGGTNWMECVYRRRSDYDIRGISYFLGLNDNLAFGTWTNDGYQAEIGTATIDAEFESVTNRVPTDLDVMFIKLFIDD